MVDSRVCYNLHIESWHKTLKKCYFNYKRNKRADKLISTLLQMDLQNNEMEKMKSLKKIYTVSENLIHKYHHFARRQNYIVKRLT